MPTASKARRPVSVQYGAFWVGPDGVHPARNGHEQWAAERYGLEHSRGREENIEQRFRNYRVAEEAGYLRANCISGFPFEIESSDRILAWGDLPLSARRHVLAFAFDRGVSVTFDDRPVPTDD